MCSTIGAEYEMLPSGCCSGVQLPAGADAVHGGVHPEGVCSSCVGHSHCQLQAVIWFRVNCCPWPVSLLLLMLPTAGCCPAGSQVGEWQ